jgi:hypothetical protein
MLASIRESLLFCLTIAVNLGMLIAVWHFMRNNVVEETSFGIYKGKRNCSGSGFNRQRKKIDLIGTLLTVNLEPDNLSKLPYINNKEE